jgi:hypothetical protein
MGFLAILLSVGLAKAQTVTPTQPPGDEKAKQEWIKSNPEAYRQMGGQVSAKKERQVNAVSAANAERPANDPNRVENIRGTERPANDPNRVENLQSPTSLDRAPLTEAQFKALPAARQQEILARPETPTIIRSSNQ